MAGSRADVSIGDDRPSSATLLPQEPFRLGSPGDRLLERALTGAQRALGRHGIVRRCQPQARRPGFPSVFVYGATGPRRTGDGRAFRPPITGAGVSDEPRGAWLAAVVEALERYCIAWPFDPYRLRRCPYEDVSEWAVPVERFGLFTPEQYQREPELRGLGPADPIDWTPAYSLTHDRWALVPAVLAASSVGASPPNDFVRGLSSTGTATHVSVEAALLSGLYEVVERDAIMVTWLNRRRPPQLTLDGASPDLQRLVERHFDGGDFTFRLLDLTLDSGLPTVCCLARSRREGVPAAAMGAATRLDPDEAARKALFEAAQVLSGLETIGWSIATTPSAADVHTFEDHARYYAASENAAVLDEWAGSAQPMLSGHFSIRPSGDAAEDLRASVERLRELGLEVLAVDLTTADVARCGFRTMKVLVPGMVDLSGDTRFPRLGSPRIASVAAAMGWMPARGGLNLAPCPLA